MNGAQLQAKRRSLYLTAEELAGFLHVELAKVERWEADLEEAPVAMQQGLLMLELKLAEDYQNNSPEYRQLVDKRHREWDLEELQRRREARKRRSE
jgi:transcriptional regulator with XRE-family HTH domain